jgi:hypothetical protein
MFYTGRTVQLEKVCFVIFHFSESENISVPVFVITFYMICSESIRDLLLVNLITGPPLKTVYLEIRPIPFERSGMRVWTKEFM